MTVGLNAFILVAGLLFAIGMFGVVLRKRLITYQKTRVRKKVFVARRIDVCLSVR